MPESTGSAAPPIASRASLPGTADTELELAVRCGLDAATWLRYETRATTLGSNPFDLAIGEGIIREPDFVAALTAGLGLVRAGELPPPDKDIRSDEAMAFRSYVGCIGGVPIRVIAANGAMASILIRQHREKKLPPLILTTRQSLLDHLIKADSARVARRAAFALPVRHSARSPVGAKANPAWLWRTRLVIAALLVAFPALAVTFPLHATILPPLILAPVFILAGLAALTATFASGAPPVAAPPVKTAQLPRYSILVPLLREANMVEALVARLSALIYPRDRIEVFILVEADDVETLAALHEARLPSWFLVLTVPEGPPRTKPRALNAALPFCSGELLVVFDAEDAPDPDQLLRAAALFHALPGEVACLQARLAVSNARDGFLTRRFAIEYAALFDCVKAGMGRAGWPVPLGGSSNHFQTSILRQVGGWDAWNVTEDADLGLRLARFGWGVEDLRSTTWEEAPNRLPAWMNQRTRWMKGWLQTFVVHARNPGQLLASLGIFRTMITASIAIAVLVGAILYPFFLLAVGLRFADPAPLGGGTPLLTIADSMLVLALVVAVLVEFIPALIALRRRRAMSLAPYILLAPVTHLLVSFAIWRAMIDLVRRPYHWHKTAHGQMHRDGGLHPINGRK